MISKKIKKILLVLAITTFLGGQAFVLFAQTTVDLTMPIPGSPSTITLCAKEGDILKCDGIANYIVALYEWFVAFTLILALVALTYGGAIWILAGGSDKRVTQAKTVIKNSLVGLFIALFSYLGLWTISPNLVQFRPIRILIPQKIELDVKDAGDTSDTTSGSVHPDAFKFPGIHCPQKGGPGELKKITDSLNSKIAYRIGGKGGPPTYDLETKQDGSGKPYKDFCPSGNLCFDCSGFITFALQCAGMNTPPMGTENIFSSAEEINTYDEATLSVNGIPLQPGDLVGSTATQRGKSWGHVAIYVGDGIFRDSNGSGRDPGGNPGTYSFKNIMKHKDDWVRSIKRYNTISAKPAAKKIKTAALLPLPEGGADSSEDAAPNFTVAELQMSDRGVASVGELSVGERAAGPASREDIKGKLARGEILNAVFSFPGINCPRGGKGGQVLKTVASLAGKITYRLGGKGQRKPFVYDKGSSYRDTCPNNNLCLDYAAFVNTVLQCSGLDFAGAVTDDMYNRAGTEDVKINDIDIDTWSINGKELEPGDLLVYPWKGSPGEEGSIPGHVIIYIGNGQFAESASSNNGKDAGRNPQGSIFDERLIERA